MKGRSGAIGRGSPVVVRLNIGLVGPVKTIIPPGVRRGYERRMMAEGPVCDCYLDTRRARKVSRPNYGLADAMG